MNDKKICIIRCVNNEHYMREQDFYISRLIVPDGYELEVLTVTGATSMCSGYNEGMSSSDAKYKIYMHQDVFVFNQYFLERMLRVFENPEIGMLGLVGTIELDTTSVPWFSDRYANIQIGFPEEMTHTVLSMDFEEECAEVSVIDGLLMATQVDIPWREDIFKGWDMYDTSQCFEMRRAGYKVVVPKQEEPWALHDEDFINTTNYYKWLNIFRKEYKKDIIDNYSEVSEEPLDVLYVVPTGGSLDIPMVLLNEGFKVEATEAVLDPNNEKKKKDVRYLENYYGKRKIGKVFSCLFIPAVAIFCHERNIPYISWVYDSPQQAVYTPEVLFNTNYLFIFDRCFAERIRNLGCKNVYHQPCATNLDRTDALGINNEDVAKFGHDISFVGLLYYEDMIVGNENRENIKETLEKYCDENLCNWTTLRPWPEMNEKAVKTLGPCVVKDMMGDALFYGTAMMSRKLAQRERVKVLNALAEKYDVHLYTKSDTSELIGVNVHESVNYYNDASKVFHLSKINLNITLPSIETGIPQRVFDIMGVGGFVMTNYQSELEELFEIDKEIVVFRNLEELDKKVKYYLSHEKERLTIAMNGYKKVKEKYSLKTTLEKIFDCVELGSEKI